MSFDVTHIIQTGGLLAIGIMIFAESGLMVGFFLPGDTLLLSAGLLAAQGDLPIGTTIFVIALAAILGDNTGYRLGHFMGPRLLQRKEGIIFRRKYIEQAEKFYAKHGSKTMLLAHFVPIVRSFAPIVAGISKMPIWQFFIFDAIGDIIWAVSVTLLGYWFGSKIPNLDHYIVPTFAAVACITFGPTLWHIFGSRETRARILARLKRSKS